MEFENGLFILKRIKRFPSPEGFENVAITSRRFEIPPV